MRQFLFVDVAIQPEVRFISKQNSLMNIGNNGNLVWGPFDESTPCLMIVLMNCQTKLRINHLTAVKSVAILETKNEKFGKAVESSANRKARREVSKKYGKFTEDCIPDGVFPIGDDVFVFTSTYYGSVSVHIKRFKKYGKTYYPTPEGITLDPRWIEYIMRKKKVPESLEELPSGLFLLNDTFK
ncbi:alpha-2 adrenergic receptor [Trichonephila clavipes]|nr:alpha-2 adrenergic receptor [Trichonephila clavipes]